MAEGSLPVDQPAPKPGRRRPAERASEILAAAETVFNQRGYDRATTREIAAEAEISEGNLYRYFASKRDILLALIDRVGESWRQDLTAIQADSFEETLIQLVTHRLRFANEHPTTILTLQQALLDPEVGQHLNALISRGQDNLMEQFRALAANGTLRPVDPFMAEEAFGSMIMGLVVGIEMAQRGLHRIPPAPEVTARALVDVLMNGLRAR